MPPRALEIFMTHAPIARKASGADPYHWLEARDSDEVLELSLIHI